ncbi:MAG: SGNH/GDSL hydrolase family protein [Candidatus Izemoplasmatales bacterium]
MKKFFLSLALILLFLAVAACDATTTTALTASSTSVTTTVTHPPYPTPTGLSVTDNVVAFDAVENASQYQLSVEDADGVVRQYLVASGFDLSLILDYGTYTFRIRVAASSGYSASEYSDPVVAELVDINAISLLSEDAMNDFRYITWIGRTRYDDLSKTHAMFYTASGFEVGFYGTGVTAVFTAQNTDILSKRPHLVIFVDGEENPYAGSVVRLSSATQTVTLVSGLTEGYHTVKVLKRSEALEGDIALKSISTDGRFASPDETKDFKILYIGDSSMTGYGNLATSVGTAKTTSNSDGLLDFAYLSAYIHDAAFSIVASSGWGVSRGWNTPGGAIDEVENMANAFDYLAIDGTNKVRTDWGRYDTTDFVPDVVVITLGTNDFNAPYYDTMTDADKTALRDRFVADYVAFLVHLNDVYPNVPIIVGYGIMADSWRIGASCRAVVAQANAVLGGRVHELEMVAAGTSYPFGSDYHPQAGTHIAAADQLANLIETVTGHERVRENVIL